MKTKKKKPRQPGRKKRFVWPSVGINEKDIRLTPVVRIDWEDACGSQGWRDAKEDFPLGKCVSVGFLINRTAKYVTLARVIETARSINGLESIPISNITDVKEMRFRK